MKSSTSHNNDVPLLNEHLQPPSVVDAGSKKKQKKPTKRKPSAKQKALAELILNNSENKSMRKLMLEAGYSQASANNAKLITEKPSFIQLMEQHGVDDDTLTSVLSDGLAGMNYIKVERVEGVGKNRLKTEEIKAVPDLNIRHKYLETALKVKQLTNKPEKPTGNTYNTFIQQNNIDPNAPGAKSIVDNTLDMLMEQTKQQ